MKKIDELTYATSCLNRARPHELIFVLMARDPAAPSAIRAWAATRVRMGKNAPQDTQITEALACADEMEKELTRVAEDQRRTAR